MINDLKKGELVRINSPTSNNFELTEYLRDNKNKICKKTVTLEDHCALDIKIYVEKTVKSECVIGSTDGEQVKDNP